MLDGYGNEAHNHFLSSIGVMPHVPRMLPVLISDPVVRQKVEDTFTSQEFMDNLEGYFVNNIKVHFLSVCMKVGFLDFLCCRMTFKPL